MPKPNFKASVREMQLMYRTPWGRLRLELLTEQLGQLHKNHFSRQRHPSLLDLGCGLGQYSAFLLRRGWRATLVDPSEEMLAASREALTNISEERFRLVKGALGRLAYRELGTHDLLLAHVVIEYLDRPNTFLRAASRLLKPGGILSLVYNQTGPAALFRLMRGKLAAADSIARSGRISDGKMGPCRTYYRAQINQLLCRSGYTILEEKGLRIYCDYLPNRLKMSSRGYRELKKLEKRASQKSELLPLARMIHLTARAPA